MRRAMMAALRLNASARGALLREPPPEPTSCCGRGRNGCVWESYDVAAADWRQEALQRMAAPPPA